MKIKTILFTLFSAAALNLSAAEGLAIKNGESVAFFNDNVGNYIPLIKEGLKSIDVDIKVIHAGRNGQTAPLMNARVEKDVISLKPDWMLLSCGVNDIWYAIWRKDTPLEQYKKEMADLLLKVEKAGIRIMVLTPGIITEDPKYKSNKRLAEYSAWLRSFAKERGYRLADVNAEMMAFITNSYQNVKNPRDYKNKLMQDNGRNTAFSGDKLIARSILNAFGATAEQIDGIEKKVWYYMPAREYRVLFNIPTLEAAQKEVERRKEYSVGKFIQQCVVDALEK